MRAAACVLLLLLLAGCGGQEDDETAPGPAPETLPGVWTGTFPCVNCPGIDVTLWLRADGRFLIEQQYRRAEAESEAPDPAFGLGRWAWHADKRQLVLTGEGPARVFEWPEAGVLLMRTASPAEHRLERTAGTTNFGAIIRVRGNAHVNGDSHQFRECLTGYDVALEKSGDYARFARQFRNVVPRGEAAPVEFEGRYAWGDDGAPTAFRIERFITLRQHDSCP